MTMYGFSIAGTFKVPAALSVAVMFKQAARAFCAALVFVNVKVAMLEEKSPVASVAIPTMACSMAVPMFVLVIPPHAPSLPPTSMISNFRLEYDDMFILR